jgi:hypothetical protein
MRPPVGHHHARRRCKAINQNAHFVINGEAKRSQNATSPAGLDPVFGRAGEGRRNCGIVHAVKETELASVVLVDFKAQAVVLGGDATNRLAIPVSHKELNIGMLELGILLGVEMFLTLKEEWGYPVRVIGIGDKRDLQEVA